MSHTIYTAAGVTITNTPTVTLGGSMLTFTCSGDNEVRTSTCGSSGWSPDPGTLDCSSSPTGTSVYIIFYYTCDVRACTLTLEPPVTCGSPAAPSRGSVDVNGGTLPFSLGSQVTYHCNEGLFPPDVRTSTCTDVEGRGEWVENPGSLFCSGRPGKIIHQFLSREGFVPMYAVNCTLPDEPSNATIVPSVNGTVVDYDRLNETVFEGTVLTYQCDNGLSLTGPNIIICTNAGVWSTDPEAIICVLPTDREL